MNLPVPSGRTVYGAMAAVMLTQDDVADDTRQTALPSTHTNTPQSTRQTTQRAQPRLLCCSVPTGGPRPVAPRHDPRLEGAKRRFAQNPVVHDAQWRCHRAGGMERGRQIDSCQPACHRTPPRGWCVTICSVSLSLSRALQL